MPASGRSSSMVRTSGIARQALTLLAEDGEGPQFKSGPAHHLQSLYEGADSVTAALEQKPFRLLAPPDDSGLRFRDLPRFAYRPAPAHPLARLAFASPGSEGSASDLAALPAAEAHSTSYAQVPASHADVVAQDRACNGSRPRDDVHVDIAFGTIDATDLVHAGTLPVSNAPLAILDGESSFSSKGAAGGQTGKGRRTGRSGRHAGLAEARLRLRDVDVNLATYLPEPFNPVLQRGMS